MYDMYIYIYIMNVYIYIIIRIIYIYIYTIQVPFTEDPDFTETMMPQITGSSACLKTS